MEILLKFFQLLLLLPRLGWSNLIRVASYRILLRTGLHPVCKLKFKLLTGCFFNPESKLKLKPLPSTRSWVSIAKYFDWFLVKVHIAPPNWFYRPVSGLPDWPSNQSWWEMATQIDSKQGDIKEIWELSRFHWVIPMAQRAANGEHAEFLRLNHWLSDWVEKNPPFLGPNWSCGQEASIRVLHLAAASLILNQTSEATTNVLMFLRAHLARISATLSYAISQDNNHGVIEAVGLFVGGEWLAKGKEDNQARKWAREGRKWIEERANRLIAEDGSFSMYSVTYHREFLDALSFAEIWRRRLNLPSFSTRFITLTSKAARWLKAFTHQGSGDAPNIGANDGTRLFQFSDSAYRDFRPSVQVSCVLFCGKKAYKSGPWDMALHWLDITLPRTSLPAEKSHQFDDGGFVILRSRSEDAQVFIRYPRFKFRPSQADLLHVDLWVRGENILRDGGSYSYNTDDIWLSYFGGTASHNTIQIDEREQMPRLSRFLFGKWHKCSWIRYLSGDAHSLSFGAGYRDGHGGEHRRIVRLITGQLEIVDHLTGVKRKAVLRWRLAPCKWQITKFLDCVKVDYITKSGEGTITVNSSSPIARCEIVKGFESRHYNERTALPVLEVEIKQSGTLTTVFNWQVQ